MFTEFSKLTRKQMGGDQLPKNQEKSTIDTPFLRSRLGKKQHLQKFFYQPYQNGGLKVTCTPPLTVLFAIAQLNYSCYQSGTELIRIPEYRTQYLHCTRILYCQTITRYKTISFTDINHLYMGYGILYFRINIISRNKPSCLIF